MSNPQTTPKERAAHFVGRLRGIAHDRGQLAALRRGLSPSTVMDAWPVVARLGGDIGQAGESAFVDIAALFASYPIESDARNFGETCRAIALANDPSERTLPESIERRFRRLLACGHAADLSAQLRSWIRLADSKKVGVNYESLMNDLLWWNRSADRTRVEWAKAFWQSGESAPTETEATTTTTP